MANDRISEDQRLEVLRHFNILDTEAEPAFDRLTRLAQAATDTPIALISLVDADRQWFKSRQGLDVPETPSSISFCTLAIEQDEPFEVSDALADPAFRDNPLVLGEPFIRSYLGVPLAVPGGARLGTLCVIDREPRKFSPRQVSSLVDLAHVVVREIELRGLAVTDSLTGALSRRGCDAMVRAECNRARRYDRDLGALMVDVDHFKQINDAYGHATGDVVLREITERLRNLLRGCDGLGRYGGDEFLLVLPETDPRGARALAERVRLAEANVEFMVGGTSLGVTVSIGAATLDRTDRAADSLLTRADAALYAAKTSGRNRSAFRAVRRTIETAA